MRPSEASWQETFEAWLLQGVCSQASARYLRNFLSVYRVRPSDDEDLDINSDNEVDDEKVILQTSEDIDVALQTKIRGKHGDDEDKEYDSEGDIDTALEAMEKARSIWRELDSNPNDGKDANTTDSTRGSGQNLESGTRFSSESNIVETKIGC